MHVRKVSSQISLCSLHKLIRDNTFCFYGIVCLLSISIFFEFFSKNTIRIANSLDPDETPRSVASHLDPNCLQRPSKFGSRTERVKIVKRFSCREKCNDKKKAKSEFV
jgi:hypothetical protein